MGGRINDVDEAFIGEVTTALVIHLALHHMAVVYGVL
jgi:hypothetical protein